VDQDKRGRKSGTALHLKESSFDSMSFSSCRDWFRSSMARMRAVSTVGKDVVR